VPQCSSATGSSAVDSRQKKAAGSRLQSTAVLQPEVAGSVQQTGSSISGSNTAGSSAAADSMQQATGSRH